MKIGAAMLHADWLEDRSSKAGTRSKIALWEVHTHVVLWKIENIVVLVLSPLLEMQTRICS
jgi:hypothetical protein